MGSDGQLEVTTLLAKIRDGDTDAEEKLFERVYNELRRMARSQMAGERPGATLQPTGLVHEAYVRLVADQEATWQNRRHFFGAAGEAMRRILIDTARRKASRKRGGDLRRVDLHDINPAVETPPEELLELDSALNRLEEVDGQMAETVKLRFFAGMSIEETADAMGISERTVSRLWTTARAWLHVELKKSAGENPG